MSERFRLSHWLRARFPVPRKKRKHNRIVECIRAPQHHYMWRLNLEGVGRCFAFGKKHQKSDKHYSLSFNTNHIGWIGWDMDRQRFMCQGRNQPRPQKPIRGTWRWDDYR